MVLSEVEISGQSSVDNSLLQQTGQVCTTRMTIPHMFNIRKRRFTTHASMNDNAPGNRVTFIGSYCASQNWSGRPMRDPRRYTPPHI
jgi:hypothetical protein